MLSGIVFCNTRHTLEDIVYVILPSDRSCLPNFASNTANYSLTNLFLFVVSTHQPLREVFISKLAVK